MAKREMKSRKVEEPKVDAVVEEKDTTAPVMVTGVVTGCSRLNVRKKASIKSDPITTIEAKKKILVTPDESTKDWYKVTTADKVEGFCMKKYITLK